MNRQSTQVVLPSGEKRMPIGTLANPALAQQLLDAFDQNLSDKEAAAKSPSFLFDELGSRLARQPVKFVVLVQMAELEDDVTDASTTWPAGRTEIPFGAITLTARVDDQARGVAEDHLRSRPKG